MSFLPPDARAESADTQSPVFGHARRTLMRVSSPTQQMGSLAGVGLIALLGIGVFLALSSHRHAHSATGATAALPQPAQSEVPALPPVMARRLDTPPPLASNPPPPPVASAPPTAAPPPSSSTSDPTSMLHAPVMVVDASEAKPPALAANVAPANAKKEPAEQDTSAEERFAARVAGSGAEPSQATRISDLVYTVPQGTMIPAVLETAIDSDLPGSVRAVVSQNVKGFDGSTVLVPRGSKLIGQYRSGVAYGQSRAFVIWSRILTPEGVSIEVGSPGTDPLGRGGLAGKTDSHFFERFGGAILLSVLTAGLESLAQSGSGTNVVIGSPLQAGTTALQPQQTNSIPVTVRVAQGSPLQVFLVRDLDFSAVMSHRK